MQLGRMWWADLRAQAIARVKPHALPLALVLLACGLGQAAVLVQTPLVSLQPLDTPQYLAVAHRILTSHSIFDPLRTPGYPLLLAAIFIVTGGQHLEAVVLVQAALLVLAALEIYLVASRIGAPRWLATLIGVLLGLNPFVLATERLILTEALAYWLVVTLALTFERLLRRPRTTTWTGFALLAVAALLTRPNLIALPALILLVLTLRSWRLHRLGLQGRALALTCGAIYAAILAYTAGNALTVHYFGLSYLTNETLFEKVYEYRLYALPFTSGDPQVVRLRAEVQAFARNPDGLLFPQRYPRAEVQAFAHTSDGFLFPQRYPDATANYWAVPGRLARAEIAQHPLAYVERSVPAIVAVAYADPYPIVPWPALPRWMSVLAAGFRFAARTYAFLPLLLLITGIQAWRHPERVSRVVLFALLLGLACHLVLTGLVDYIEFWRLRFPLDWIIMLAFALVLVEWVQALAGGLARLRLAAPQAPPRQLGRRAG